MRLHLSHIVHCLSESLRQSLRCKRNLQLIDQHCGNLAYPSTLPAMPGFLSFRESIRWLPDEASEPTVTIVLSGKETGAFVDVRFLKDGPSILDWAFAGFRHAGELSS